MPESGAWQLAPSDKLFKGVVNCFRRDAGLHNVGPSLVDGPDFLAEHGKIAPIKRAANPEEIAEVVAFLASDKASFMVGSIVMADGGISVIIQ